MISLFGPKIGTILNIILVLGFLVNLVLAFILIFLERNRRSASSTWAWIFVLFVLPVLGFILYLFFGRTVSKRKMEKNNGKELDVYKDILEGKYDHIPEDAFRLVGSMQDVIAKAKDMGVEV